MIHTFWCHVFVTPERRSPKRYSVQFQLPGITLTIPARDLTFAPKATRFIAETRDNSRFRDKHLGRGRYRRMPDKLVDLSRSFVRAGVTLLKDGEFDDRYFLRIAYSRGNSVDFTVGGQPLDALIGSLREIIDDHGGNSSFESSAWHEEALRKAERAVQSGEAKFTDWEDAKKRLRRKTAKRA